MESVMFDQLEIGVAELLRSPEETTKKISKFNVELDSFVTTEPLSKNSKAALMQINIAKADNENNKLEESLKLISQRVSAVTIFIDLQLELLSLKIILPYMHESKLQELIEIRKSNWISKNIDIINQVNIPWSIVSSQDPTIKQCIHDNTIQLCKLMNDDANLSEHIAKDAKNLKSYLIEINNISENQYQQSKYNNDKELQLYIINHLATIAAMNNFHSYQYTYITPNRLYSYKYLTESALLKNLPPCSVLEFTAINTTDDVTLQTSAQLNNEMHDFALLDKILLEKSYLEQSIKCFQGNAYLISLNNTFIAHNKIHSLHLGIAEKSYLEGKNVSDAFCAEDARKIAATTNDIIAKNQPQTLIEAYPMAGNKLSYLSLKMPLRNKKKEVIGIIGFSIPIGNEQNVNNVNNTQPKCITNKIITDNATTCLMDTMKNMPGNIFWQDTTGKIIGCNNAHALLLGYSSPDDIVGKYPDTFLTAEYAKDAQQELAGMIATGNPIIKEEVYRCHNNNLMVMLSHKTPVKDEHGKMIGIMVVAIDISKNKQDIIKLEQEKEALEIANNFKNQIIKDLEHNMRTPFLDLCSMTESHAAKETNPTKQKQLYEISNCAKDLLAYYNSLLEFSKNESFTNNNNNICLKDLATSIVNTSITAIRAKNLNFKLDYDDNIPATIIGDDYRLRRILSNLMSNSVKYTDQGYIKLAIKLEYMSANNASISFTVTDSGIGISKEDQQRAFSKYSSLNYTKRQANSGHGLGLNEVNRFVEDLKGKLTLDSEINKGTKITINLSFSMLSQPGVTEAMQQQETTE